MDDDLIVEQLLDRCKCFIEHIVCGDDHPCPSHRPYGGCGATVRPDDASVAAALPHRVADDLFLWGTGMALSSRGTQGLLTRTADAPFLSGRSLICRRPSLLIYRTRTGRAGVCEVNTGLFLPEVRFDNRPPLTGFPICWTDISEEKMSFSDIREKIVRIFVDNSDRFF